MLSLEIKCQDAEALQNLLYNSHQIEIPVIPYNGKVYIRYSINGFNTPSDLDVLYDALKAIKSEGRLVFS